MKHQSIEFKHVIQSTWAIHHVTIHKILVIAGKEEELLRRVNTIKESQYLLVILTSIRRVYLLKLIHQNDDWLLDTLYEKVEQLVSMKCLVNHGCDAQIID